MQRSLPAAVPGPQVGGVQRCAAFSVQSAAETHGSPTSSQPVRVALQTCGCRPLQNSWPTAQAGAQMPAIQGVVQAGPTGVKPVRSLLQTSGCCPLQ
jgi:hypothetical protein